MSFLRITALLVICGVALTARATSTILQESASKAAAQQDDLALVGIERQSILAPADQVLDGPLEIGDRHGVQQGEANQVK